MVGNGNVAVDVARILTADPESLAGTSIAPAALRQLRASKVREVVLLARRGPEHAAYSVPELLALIQQDDVELVVDSHDPSCLTTIDAAATGSKAAMLRDVRREPVDWTASPEGERRRIVLRFGSAPLEVVGDTDVRGLRVSGVDDDVEIAAGRVVASVGYRGMPVPGLPFDQDAGTIPHDRGRVSGRPGAYVVGWVKRGPSGGIGANRACAQETVGSLLADLADGRLRARRQAWRRPGLLRRVAR